MVVIQLGKTFNFGNCLAFRAEYESVERGRRIILDMAETGYIDSSALGMLLVCKERLDAMACTLTLRRPRPEVRRVLEIAGFHQIFLID